MLRKGDIVTIQGTVRWDVLEDDKRVNLEIESAINHVSVDASTVTVFRQELRIGDRVRPTEYPRQIGSVLAVDGDDVFVRDDDGFAAIWKISSLIRIEKEPTNGVD